MIFFIILSLLTTLSFSEDDIYCLDGKVSSFAKIATIPNCIRDEEIVKARAGEANSICNECKIKFNQATSYISPPLLKPYSKKDKQLDYLKIAFKEYQKNVSNNLLEALKLRAVRPTGVNFEKSLAQCKSKAQKEFQQSCNSKTAKDLATEHKLFDEMNSNMSKELAKLVSTSASYKPLDKELLLDRKNTSCFIPEKDVLLVTSSAIEESLADVLSSLVKLDDTKFKSINRIFMEVSEETGNDLTELIDALRTHPILSIYSKDPKTFLTLLKKTEKPLNVDNLRKTIYSKETGSNFDSLLSTNCENSYSQFIKSVCSDEFEKGDLSLNLFDNLSRILPKDAEITKTELANDELSISNNAEILRRCDNSNAKQKLTQSLNDISQNLETDYKNNSYEEYKFKKHNFEIGITTDVLCKNGEKECSEPTLNCRLISNYKELKTKGTSLNNLANSSNPEVNNLLRTMLGDTTTLDSATKAILVGQGIVPKTDGSIEQQRVVPERNTAQIAAAPTKSNQARSVQSLAQSNTSNRNTNQNQNDSYDNYSSPSSTESVGRSSMADEGSSEKSDTIKNHERELKEVQDEIRRRMAQLPNKKPTSVSQARTIASDSFKALNQPYTQNQVNSFADEMMSTQGFAASNVNQMAETSQNRSAVSPGKTIAKKFQEEQAAQALMGMAGAQQSALNDHKVQPSQKDSNAKDLTKLALNIAEDPKFTLSEVFNKKLDPNDPETKTLKELLKKQSNFVLQLKSLNFKVVFDKNSFNLLLESGDKAEAERIRPQLEIFLNKLKRNNTLHNLNQTWST